MVFDLYFEQNKKHWDARTPIHVKSQFYDVEEFCKGKSSLTAIEHTFLPKIKDRKLLHLQCHFGQDTLSLARKGATCTGIDFSQNAIDAAKTLSKKIHVQADFVCGNVYDIPTLNLGKFDMVFTTYGVISWLPDLKEWATIIYQSLEKGGEFYMAEFHPALYQFDFNTRELFYPYFNTGQIFEEEEEGTYAEPTSSIKTKSYFWQHSLEEVIQNLIDAGLHITCFKEFDYSPYNCFPNMEHIGENKFRFGKKEWLLPHVFLIKAISLH